MISITGRPHIPGERLGPYDLVVERGGVDYVVYAPPGTFDYQAAQVRAVAEAAGSHRVSQSQMDAYWPGTKVLSPPPQLEREDVFVRELRLEDELAQCRKRIKEILSGSPGEKVMFSQTKVQVHIEDHPVTDIEVPSMMVRSMITMANAKGAGVGEEEDEFDWEIIGRKKR